MSKKMEAKASMLKELSKKNKDDSFGEKFGKGLKAKKVTVMAPDEEGLEKGLSMAQKLMKAKFGEIKEKEESEEEEYEECPECDGEGCPMCEESEEEAEEE